MKNGKQNKSNEKYLKEKKKEDDMEDHEIYKIKTFEIIRDRKPPQDLSADRLGGTCDKSCQFHPNLNKLCSDTEDFYQIKIPSNSSNSSDKKKYIDDAKKTADFTKNDARPNESLTKALEKIENDHMPYFRKVKGDGNCFFRSAGFVFLKNILLKSRCEAKEELDKFSLVFIENESTVLEFELKGGMQKMNDILKNCRIGNKSNKYYIRSLVSLLQKLVNEDHKDKVSILLNLFNNDEVFDFCLILSLRIVCFINVEKNKNDEFYKKEEIMGQQTPAEVLQIFDREAEDIIITGLFQELKLEYIIIVLQPKGSKSEPREYTFYTLKSEGYDNENAVVLFFRPGHYDIGYNKLQCERDKNELLLN